MISVGAMASYIGSYTARIGPYDHYSSRGLLLRDAAEILRQDRANYYRFGLRDPEDTGTGYFRSRFRRARIGQMLRRGRVERGILREIRDGNPLLRIDLYTDHLELRRAGSAPITSYTPSVGMPSALPDRSAVHKDVTARLRAHGGPSAFGLNFSAPLEHRIVFIQPFAEEGVDKLFVLTASNARSDGINHCHACAPALSAFIYRKGSAGWQRERASYAFTEYGSWGEGPEAKEAALVRISPRHYALALRGGGTGQGWLVESYTLYLLGRKGMRKVFRTIISEDNGGSASPLRTDWKSDLRLRPGTGAFYEIELRRYGIRENRRFDERFRYRYDGRAYRPDRPDPLGGD
ncbi:hypothetical protein [Nitratifractor sp.]